MSRTIAGVLFIYSPRLRYLGGDIQHTHLVKGLDMSLLAKVSPNQTLFLFSP